MKRISLYIMSLLALSFTACTEDFNVDVAQPQSWEQDPAAAGMTFATAEVAGVDLGAVATDLVTVLSFTAPAVAEGAEVTGYDVVLDGKKTLSMNATGQVSAEELQAIVTDFYGKRPTARTMSGVASVLVAKDGQVFRVKAPAKNIIVTPKAPFIDTEYYMIGSMTNWVGDDPGKLIKFGHSGKDVYVDSKFSIMMEVAEGDKFKIIPKSSVDELKAGTIGSVWDKPALGSTVADAVLEGQLTTDNGKDILLANAGWVRITLDMMDSSYIIEELGDISPYMYVAGNHQGWNPATAPAVFASDFITYKGFVSLDGGFKFTSERNWDGTNYGSGGEGILSATGGDLSKVAGFYLLEANMSDMKWKATAITTMGLIGSATEGGWDTSTPMTFDAATVTYTVTATLTDGEFKFRANDGWDINLGGSLNGLTFGGDNIAASAGTYLITLDLSKADAFKATVVAK